MDFLYENLNPYELINYYKDIHEYYHKHKQNIYNILRGLDNEIIIQEDDKKDNDENNGDFSNFYFFYIQTLKPITKRKTFRLKNVKEIKINNADDFLVGLNFSKCEIGSDIRINLNVNNLRKKIFRVIITEKNKNNLFYPINNKNFFPYFLSNENVKLTIQSNKNIPEVDCIYLKLHRNYSNKFFNFGSFVLNFRDNTYLEFKDFSVRMLHSYQEIYPNEFLFFWNIDKYYGRKIFNFIKKCKLKRFVKNFISNEYNIYDDISNTLCKFI